MAQNQAPNRPLHNFPFVDARTGNLTQQGLAVLEQLWRQVAAGFVVVPCTAAGTNVITLTPTLHAEGARTYADHMVFAAVAANTTTGLATGKVGTLATIKVYKTDGAAQATTGDIVADSLYLFVYNSALDGGAGGLVLK